MRSSIAPGFGRLATAVCLSLGGALTVPVASAQPAQPVAGMAQQSDPRTTQTVVEQANRLAGGGRADEAVQLLDDALRRTPRDPQLRFLYGVLITERGRNADAIAVFEQLIADFPELPEPYNNLAVLFAAAGDLDRARAALEDAVRALPGYALAQENLGDLYLRLAVRAYGHAQAADPRSDTARVRLAQTRALLDRLTPSASGTRTPRAN